MGVFNKIPNLPWTNVTWYPYILLKFIKTLSHVKSISPLKLSCKLVALLWIISGQRSQGLHLIDRRNVTITNHVVKIRFGDLMKQPRPGYQQNDIVIKAYAPVRRLDIVIKAYAPDRRLDIVLVVKEYLRRTAKLRGKANQLLISSQKPLQAI